MDDESMSIKLLVAKLLLWSLVGFDALLGGLSMFAPDLTLRIFAPDAEPQGHPLLRRAAAIWLFFIPMQLWAAVKTENPTALKSVAVLRLQEVPADPLWLATGEGFGIFGKFGLIFAPLFNLFAGTFLWKLGSDLEKGAKAKEAIL